MAITALHRALGWAEQGFTWAMLEQVIAEEIEECAQLDWKSSGPLPDGDQDAVQLELTKDLAAMANSGGGVIVYGLKEKKRDRAQAVEIVDVEDLDEGMERRLRQIGWGMIHPPMNVRWHRVINDAQNVHVIVAEIPDSVTAPHLVHRKGDAAPFGVPWRDGPHTRWMDEPSIAAAYAHRFEHQRRHLQTMDGRVLAFTKALPQTELDVWVTAVAIPVGVTNAPSLPVDHETTTALLSQAWGTERWDRRHPGPRELLAQVYPRPGMRRAVYEDSRAYREPRGRDSWKQHARVEIHADGTLAVAYSRGSAGTAENVVFTSSTLVTTDVEETVTSLLGLMWAVQAAATTSFDYLLRISVHVNDRTVSIKVPSDVGGDLTDLKEGLSFFEDLQDVIAMETTHEEFLRAGTALQRDAVNQLGIDRLEAPANHETWLGAHGSRN